MIVKRYSITLQYPYHWIQHIFTMSGNFLTMPLHIPDTARHWNFQIMTSWTRNHTMNLGENTTMVVPITVIRICKNLIYIYILVYIANLYLSHTFRAANIKTITPMLEGLEALWSTWSQDERKFRLREILKV